MTKYESVCFQNPSTCVLNSHHKTDSIPVLFVCLVWKHGITRCCMERFQSYR